MSNLYDSEDIKKLPRLGAGAPEAWKAFLAFDHAAFAEGAIPVKYKELMALAVALTTQCPYCLMIHKEKAAKAGATPQESPKPPSSPPPCAPARLLPMARIWWIKALLSWPGLPGPSRATSASASGSGWPT